MTVVDLPLAVGRNRAAALRRLLEEDCFAILAVAACATLIALLLPYLVTQDTWLALVDGRWIAQHGLPQVDQLGVWTHGVRWIDQQWLAHLGMYELARYGGLRLVLGGCLAVTFAGVGVAIVAGRRAGGSSRSVAIALLLALVGAPGLLEPRTQMFAVPLFAIVYALLAADARTPSRRIFYVLPLLVVWANLHGSAVLGVGLVCLHAVLQLLRRRFATVATLLVGAPAALFVTPYGLSVAHYYSWMLLGSPLRGYVVEWAPATLGRDTIVFFATAFGLLVGIGRRPRVLTPFESLALPLLVIAGLMAVRNEMWVALATIVSGPLLLDGNWRAVAVPDVFRKLNRRLAAAALVVAVGVTAASLARPAASFERPWPVAGAQAVAAAAGAHGLVLADDRHTDWLLWEEPQLAGRVAYDVRFELLTRAQLADLHAFLLPEGSQRLARGFRVLTFPVQYRATPFARRFRTAYARHGLYVLVR